MFDFKKKILNPVVSGFVNEIDSALRMQSASDKVEHLLAVKDTADKRLRKIVAFEMSNAVPWLLAGVCAMGTVFVGLTVAPVLGVIGVGIAYKKLSNSLRATSDYHTLRRKIDNEVFNVAAAQPQEAAKSPRFIQEQALKKSFDAAASSDAKSYAILSARVTPRPVLTV
jgi:hypothetical protein